MEAAEVVLSVVNKNLVSRVVQVVRPGPIGYGLLLKLRVLLFGVLVEKFMTRELLRHLQKQRVVLRKLGFGSLPDKRTLDRWKRSFQYELEQVITLVGDEYLQLSESEWTLIDSTPIKDENDPESSTGYNSQGRYKGFKLHMSCDEKRVPLRAIFTTANVHDSMKGEALLTTTHKAGGDAAYDSKQLKKAAQKKGVTLITSHNPRREGRATKKRTPKILKKVRVCIEQCNGLLKSQVLKHTYKLVKGFSQKASHCLLGVLAIQALALANLKTWGYPSIRITKVRN